MPKWIQSSMIPKGICYVCCAETTGEGSIVEERYSGGGAYKVKRHVRHHYMGLCAACQRRKRLAALGRFLLRGSVWTGAAVFAFGGSPPQPLFLLPALLINAVLYIFDLERFFLWGWLALLDSRHPVRVRTWCGYADAHVQRGRLTSGQLGDLYVFGNPQFEALCLARL